MPNNPPTPRRHWFRFGLRAMFVVLTVVSCFLGRYSLMAARRNQSRAWISTKGGFVSDATCAPANLQSEKDARFAEIRRIFGDQRTRYINLVGTKATWKERQEIARLFPEAWVVPERPAGLDRRALSQR